MDAATRAVHLSRFANGKSAPFHILDGLPDELVLARTAAGRVAAAKPSVVSGFVREGLFYTRDEAAAFLDRSFSEPIENHHFDGAQAGRS